MAENDSELSLRETCDLVIRYTERGNYPAAVAGLDAILNSLIAHQKSIRNSLKLATMLSWALGNVIAFGLEGSTDERKRATALAAYRDARDFTSSQQNRESLGRIIEALENGMPFDELKSYCEPSFPDETVDTLRKVATNLDGIGFAPIPPGSEAAITSAAKKSDAKTIIKGVAALIVIALAVILIKNFIGGRNVVPVQNVGTVSGDTAKGYSSVAEDLPAEMGSSSEIAVRDESSRDDNVSEAESGDGPTDEQSAGQETGSSSGPNDESSADPYDESSFDPYDGSCGEPIPVDDCKVGDTVYVGKNMYVYDGPDGAIDYEVYFFRGDEMLVLSVDGDWIKIGTSQYSNFTGWCRISDVSAGDLPLIPVFNDEPSNKMFQEFLNYASHCYWYPICIFRDMLLLDENDSYAITWDNGDFATYAYRVKGIKTADDYIAFAHNFYTSSYINGSGLRKRLSLNGLTLSDGKYYCYVNYGSGTNCLIVMSYEKLSDSAYEIICTREFSPDLIEKYRVVIENGAYKIDSVSR